MTNLWCMIIATNIVRQACHCGFCEGNIVVPEHINRIGYDLRVEVVTNYYPIVTRSAK